MSSALRGAHHLPTDALNERRRHAVQLRLAGKTLAEAAAAAGLSMPTVIAAMNAFTRGGWDAVAIGRRGRGAGEGRLLQPQQLHRLLALMNDATVPAYTDAGVQALAREHFGARVGLRTMRRYLAQCGLVGAGAGDDTPARRPGSFTVTVHEVCVLVPGVPGEHAVQAYPFLVARGGRQRLALTSLRQPLAAALAKLAAVYAGAGHGRVLTAQVGGIAPSHLLALELPPHLRVVAWAVAATRVRLVLPPIEPAPPTAPAPALPKASAPAPELGPSPARTAPTLLQPTPARASQPEPLTMNTQALTHLQRLEAESIHIMREVVAEADRPVMLYSIGKDSAVMLHLARKAFFPAPPPFPLLHVDTRWKFRAMYELRDRMAKEAGMDLLVHVNPDGVAKDINPFTHGSSIHTEVMKTEGLKQALEKYGFDVAFGGARRDEEKSRSKERVFSFRNAQHRWDPKNQRPELWRLYNARKHRGESIRVFPLSNWTELDVWQYIHLHGIPIVPLYLAAVRPVVERDGALILVDDERLPLRPGEAPMMKKVRFRTLGCYPLTGAIESDADTLPAVVGEMLRARTSERQGRVIDHDATASMEKKKQEGYF